MQSLNKQAFVQIDNTYSEEELHKIFLELEFLRSCGSFAGPKETGSAENITDNIKKYKNNHGVFIDQLYTDRQTSNILKFNRKLYQADIDLSTTLKAFKHFKTANRDTTLISYYGNGDNYFSHTDTSVLTLTTYLYKLPKKFTGGNLILHDYGIILEPVFNRTYIFPSYIDHEVTPVVMSQDDADAGYGRYCISNFMNFK